MHKPKLYYGRKRDQAGNVIASFPIDPTEITPLFAEGEQPPKPPVAAYRHDIAGVFAGVVTTDAVEEAVTPTDRVRHLLHQLASQVQEMERQSMALRYLVGDALASLEDADIDGNGYHHA